MHGSWVVLLYGRHLIGNVGVPALDAPESNIRGHQFVLGPRGTFGILAFLGS